MVKDEESPLQCLVIAEHPAVARDITRFLARLGATVVGQSRTPSEIEEVPASLPIRVVVSSFETLDLAVRAARRFPTSALLVLSSFPADTASPAPLDAIAGGGRIQVVRRDDAAQPRGTDWESTLALSRRSRDVLIDLMKARCFRPTSQEVLTRRERQVVEQVTEGRSNRQIAQSLNIAEQTVKNHLRSVMRKVCVSSRTELFAWAIESGFGRARRETSYTEELDNEWLKDQR